MVGHAIPKVLAVITFKSIPRGLRLTMIIVLDLAATCTGNDDLTVDVVARMSYFVQHEASYETANRMTSALIAAKVVQSLAQIHTCISPYCWLPDWLWLGRSIGAVCEELVSNLVELFRIEP